MTPAVVLAALALVVPAVTPPTGILDEAATAYKPAVRVDPPAPPPCDIECVIRAVWPDQLEDRALAIAWRESRWVPTVRNACCWGLYQIYWTVHRSWLCPELGICNASQLYDPRTNAEAAYALYQRAGGWGPWAL
jgi:hypothetical protein